MMKAIVFDLDGTLLNTLEDIRASINYARIAFDGEPISLDDTRRYVGNGLRKALVSSILEHGPRLECEDELDLMFQLMVQYYKNHPAVYSKPYDGILSLLDCLKTSGYKLAILSNKADSIVQEITQKCFKKDLFDIVQGQRSELALKPDPMALLGIIKRLMCNNDDVLYIGDSEVDYKTAINANVKHLIVSYGFRSKEELERSGIFDSIAHVPTMMDIERGLSS